MTCTPAHSLHTHRPDTSRWLLWVSGLLLLYPLCVAITKAILLIIEVILVGLVVTEVRHTFVGCVCLPACLPACLSVCR